MLQAEEILYKIVFKIVEVVYKLFFLESVSKTKPLKNIYSHMWTGTVLHLRDGRA